MLTKDLLRAKTEGERVRPVFLKATPAVRDAADALLLFYRSSVGQTRGDLQDQVTPYLHRLRSLVVARGLQKLILDRCEFTNPADAADLRWQALLASAERLADPPEHARAHCAAVAASLAVSPEALASDLYADLPHEARLESAPDWSVDQLVDRYNLALVQGLVARCGEIELAITANQGGQTDEDDKPRLA